jgi:hypothetical protein
MGKTRYDKLVGKTGLYVGATKDSEIEVIDGDGVVQFRKARIIAKTADYTVKATESGAIFTTTGASGAVNFTLPAKAAGLIYTFINTVGQNMVITPDAVDTIVTFNDAAADTVTFSTAGNLIGAMVTVVCDGTKWIVINNSANTATVAT